MNERPIDMTPTLSAVSAGDEPAARRLIPVVYEELRSLAAAYFRRLPPGQTLEPTALVHEAFVRLVRQPNVPSEDRAHFFAVAASAMRGVLVDAIRAKATAKRGGGYGRLTLSGVEDPAAGEAIDMLVLDDALERLAKRSERQARVVELRFFAGMKVSDVAFVLGVSKTTVEQDWRIARAWLSGELKDEETAG
ncbi:MAG: sigma-70 family RNA polymerase sigma factor [Phycisphaerales bacterium]